MSAIRSFVRREPVLLIAALTALVTCFFVPPDAHYLGYLDLRTLALLYCLMTVVNGFRKAGLFAHLSHILCEKAGNLRLIGLRKMKGKGRNTTKRHRRKPVPLAVSDQPR